MGIFFSNIAELPKTVAYKDLSKEETSSIPFLMTWKGKIFKLLQKDLYELSELTRIRQLGHC